MGWLRKLFKNKVVITIIILVLAVSGYFVYRNFQKNQTSVRYETSGVVKGTFIASVSGTGQVSASNQIDLKPKISGELVYFALSNGQEVKAGSLIVQLDSREALKSIRDAEVVLDNAKAKLEELLSQPDAKSRLQAENALAQAERDLNKAKENYEQIEIDAERSLAAAYEDGYTAVSTAFFKLSDYMKDLKDVLGTEQSTEEHISAYKLILGLDSPFIQKLLDDYYRANNLFNENFAFFRGVYRDDDRDTIYQLIGNTLKTTKTISQALESARHMFDAIAVKDYRRLTITSHIDKMKPKIESDISSVYSDISSLKRIKDTIDDTNKDTPKKIEDAKLSIQSAQEKLDEKKLALEELMAGADPQDIQSQKNTVAQKEDALLDAKENLAECFIRAPFDGIIAGVNTKIKKGDSVSAGTVLASVITQQKIAEISLNEIDVAKVKVGQKTTLTFDALENFELTGQVGDIDAIGTVTSGIVSYNVKIGFDTQDERIKPGMSVSAVIINEVKPDVLLVPNSAVKTQEVLGSYVEVLENGVLQIRPLEVYEANDTLTEVSGNIQEGEQVVTQTLTSNNQQQQQAGGILPIGGGFGGGVFRSGGQR